MIDTQTEPGRVKQQQRNHRPRRRTRTRTRRVAVFWVTVLLLCAAAGVRAFGTGSNDVSAFLNRNPTVAAALQWGAEADAWLAATSDQLTELLQLAADTLSDPAAGLGGVADAKLPPAEPKINHQGDAGAANPEIARLLAALELVSDSGEPPSQPYARSSFGSAWNDVDHNGCDTRNDVLQRDLEQVKTARGNRCMVIGGTLRDPYTSSVFAFDSRKELSLAVQIDHVVALSWAWQHGAAEWDTTKRVTFANDPENLLATTAEQNREKSDSGFAEWLPPNDAGACQYVQRSLEVILRYGLSLSSAEKDTARSVLLGCGG